MVPSPDLLCVFNDHGMDTLIAKLSEYTGKSVPDLIRDRAVMLGRYLAEITPPFEQLAGPLLPNQAKMFDGGTLIARNLGRRAVKRDLGRVYRGARSIYKSLAQQSAGDVGKAMANKFWKAIKTGNIGEAKRILSWSGIAAKGLDIVTWDGGARHRQLRTKRGRVNKGTAPVIVTDQKALSAYAKGVEGHVGWTKAGWITAASQVSTRGLGQIRGWIKVHPAPGRGQDGTRHDTYPVVYLTNAVPWVSDTVSDSTLARAMVSFEASLAKEVEIALARVIAKAERQQLKAA